VKIYILPSYQAKKDLITFFPLPHSIECDSELLYETLQASLQMKHEVFLLEKELIEFPVPDSVKRWEVGDSWIWLSARSRSPLMKTFCGTPMSYCQFKDFLSQNK